ncbi:MAG: hypothetical protein FD146_741 [Anaerolineaceae bacterium]|nr:MAG: hypothetical protein FD146_741 [Anaerolineaceae bacterium]
MPTFYRQAQEDKFTGSPAYLESRQSAFRNDQASGLIEIQATAEDRIVLLYADGLLAGSYRLGPDARTRIPAREIASGWDKPEAPIRTVSLPDPAGRSLWLALESRTVGSQEVRDAAGWNRFIESSGENKLSALVEINSEQCDGFLHVQNGLIQPTETILSTPRGFLHSLAEAQAYLAGPLNIRLLEPESASLPCQCALLRLSATRWGNRLLARYLELVGQRLLQTLNSKLNSMLVPWQWNIQLTNVNIIDRHFFPKVEMAVQAYRALFITMNEQIAEVIGGMLARRLLAETYSQLEPEEVMLLESRTLTPVVFAE